MKSVNFLEWRTVCFASSRFAQARKPSGTWATRHDFSAGSAARPITLADYRAKGGGDCWFRPRSPRADHECKTCENGDQIPNRRRYSGRQRPGEKTRVAKDRKRTYDVERSTKGSRDRVRRVEHERPANAGHV